MNNIESEFNKLLADWSSLVDDGNLPGEELGVLNSVQAIKTFSGLLLGYQTRLQNLVRLKDITRSLLEIDEYSDRQNVLKKVAIAAQKSTNADNTILIPTSLNGNLSIEETISAGVDEQYIRIPMKPRKHGVTHYLLTTPQGFVNVLDTRNHEDYPFLDKNPNSFINRVRVRTFLGLRIASAQKNYGVLFVNRCTLQPFTKEDIQFIKLLGDFAGIALQNTEQFAQTKERLDRLDKHTEAITKIQSGLSRLSGNPSSSNLEKLLDQILQTALEATSSKGKGFGFITLVDEADESFSIRASVGLEKKHWDYKFSIGDGVELVGINAHVLKHGMSELISDVTKDTRFLDLFQKNTISQITVPIKDGDHILGTINIESSEFNDFDAQELELIESFSMLISVALRSMEHKETIDTISQIILQINSSLDLEYVIDTFFDGVERLANARDMTILLFDKIEKCLTLRPELTRASEFAKTILKVEIGKGISGTAADLGKTIYFRDVGLIKDNEEQYIPWIESTRANLATPLMVGEKLIGVLNIESPHVGAFDGISRELLQILASSAAIAINNIGQHQRIVRMESINMTTTLLSDMVHDIINNQIHGARVVIEGLLNSLSKGEITDIRLIRNDLEEVYEAILAAISESRNLVSQFNIMAETKPVDTVRNHMKMAEGKLKRGFENINIDWNFVPKQIRTARVIGPLDNILYNLAQNSINAMGSQGKVTITMKKEKDWLKVSVSDTGGGIPADLIDSIFEPGVRGGSKSGLGYGLWISKERVEILGGKFEKPETGEKGTTFTFWLPLAV